MTYLGRGTNIYKELDVFARLSLVRQKVTSAEHQIRIKLTMQPLLNTHTHTHATTTTTTYGDTKIYIDWQFKMVQYKIKFSYIPMTNLFKGGCPRGVMVKEMDFGIQSRYYDHLRVNTIGKGMNPLILPAMV